MITKRELKEAFRRYAWHENDCRYEQAENLGMDARDVPCTCGLREMWERLKLPEGEV